MFVVQLQQFGCRRGEYGRVPTIATSMLDTVAHMPVVSQRQVSGMVETVQYTVEAPQLALIDLLVFLGPCTQVHGQGSPAIRAGKGWRGRRELAPRCSATQLGASHARALD